MKTIENCFESIRRIKGEGGKLFPKEDFLPGIFLTYKKAYILGNPLSIIDYDLLKILSKKRRNVTGVLL